ncbi:hypothetical protein SEA_PHRAPPUCCINO_176 [Mycobacterium phage Phrappuccino]|uniref:Minor tail protein n=1 Tax=Mycobacterium phage Phrappuccino TaxID=2591223 RepID=A0A514DE09_9CAUD|nr:hypothetical protein KHQ87_gp176 [Mycobacterium phage Phrappuccino]QDH91851.1 hypothetical protein SEA_PHRAPPUCCINO_176 [Mycobacterium phage Phrappuccino]QIQ63292.1 hypothetical protein SEA_SETTECANDELA_176 [Mycobacterium phage Settecandela]
MANALYDLGREAFLNGEISWRDHVIKAVLIDTDAYTVNLATHQYLSAIGSGAQIAISPALTSKTWAAGVAGAANLTFPAPVTGPTGEALALFCDTGTASTSPLIGYVDTVASGLPVTPNGGPIVIEWSTGSNKIFKL